MKDYKEFQDNFEQFRERSISLARDAAQTFRDEFQTLQEDLKARAVTLRDYIEGDEFERDLDRLADRLRVDLKDYESKTSSSENRLERVRAKARFLLGHGQKEILKSAEMGSAVGLFSRKSRVVLAIGLVCGGIKGGEIFYECLQVFAQSARRRGLRVV